MLIDLGGNAPVQIMLLIAILAGTAAGIITFLLARRARQANPRDRRPAMLGQSAGHDAAPARAEPVASRPAPGTRRTPRPDTRARVAAMIRELTTGMQPKDEQ